MSSEGLSRRSSSSRLAPLAKETAIVTPMALLAWELSVSRCLPRDVVQRRARSWPLPQPMVMRSRSCSACCPAGAGSPITITAPASISAIRSTFAITCRQRSIRCGSVSPCCIRLWHVFGYLNLFLLTVRRDLCDDACSALQEPMARSARASRSTCNWSSPVVLLANVAGRVGSGRSGARALHASGRPAGDSGVRLDFAPANSPLDVVGCFHLRSIRGSAVCSSALPHRARRHASLSRLRDSAQEGG